VWSASEIEVVDNLRRPPRALTSEADGEYTTSMPARDDDAFLPRDPCVAARV